MDRPRTGGSDVIRVMQRSPSVTTGPAELSGRQGTLKAGARAPWRSGRVSAGRDTGTGTGTGPGPAHAPIILGKNPEGAAPVPARQQVSGAGSGVRPGLGTGFGAA